MKKLYLLFGLILVACCILTSVVTRWFLFAELSSDLDYAGDIHSYKSAFDDFLQNHQLGDGEQINGEKLPARLKSIGIVNVYRNGRLVYFVLTNTSLLADDATSEFIYQLDNDGGAIEEILRTTHRNTYHIQHLSSAPRWYYWMHN
jgi:hypothetical protein